MTDEVGRQVTVGELLDIINDLTDTGRCHYDHHGYCQEHAWFTEGVECPHARGQKLWDDEGKLKVTVNA